MSGYGLLVIGSGPAGVNAATAYVAAGGPGPALIVTADQDPPYQRPPLSKGVLTGEAPAEGTPIGKQPLPTQVEVRIGAAVSAVDLEARTVTAGGDQLTYERLVIATGARPQRFPDADPDAEIHHLRSLEDARRLTTSAQHARSALVIGSGFIGCEAAASLARRGVATTLVTPEDGPQRQRLGAHVAAQIGSWLTDLGVELRTGVTVLGIRAPRTAHLSDDTTLAPDLILMAIGIEAAAGFLDGTGLQLHEGRVVADEHLAAHPAVWVAGDSARPVNTSAGRALSVEHWGDALAMGSLAGTNAAAGEDAQQPWSDVPGFWSTIGEHTIKYAAWADGHETESVVERTGGFTVWYGDASGVCVGVLTYNADDDLERGEALVASGATVAQALRGDRVEPAGDEDQQDGAAGSA